MASATVNGTYGTKRPATITKNDVDIFYFYKKSRSSDSTDFSQFKRLSTENFMTTTVEGDDTISTGDTSNPAKNTMVLPGMYNLRLPLSTFGKAGIYTIYIKPKEIYCEITDVSSLSQYPDINGIVLNAKLASGYTDSSIFNDGNLVGYRLEYFDDNITRQNYYRIITSNNRCEPVNQNLIDSSLSGISYRFNQSSYLIFCTLTPSVAMSFKSDSIPYLGSKGQKVALINTKFNPFSIEVEMTNHDIETISTMLEGTQIRNLDKGIITTFNSDGEIYHQSTYGNIIKSDSDINHDFRIPNDDEITRTESDYLNTIKNNI